MDRRSDDAGPTATTAGRARHGKWLASDWFATSTATALVPIGTSVLVAASLRLHSFGGAEVANPIVAGRARPDLARWLARHSDCPLKARQWWNPDEPVVVPGLRSLLSSSTAVRRSASSRSARSWLKPLRHTIRSTERSSRSAGKV